MSPPFALLCCATLILLPVASATLSDLPAATATLPRLPAATATLARFAVADVPRCRVAWPLAAPTRVSRWAVLCLLTPPAADRFSACSRDMAKRSWPEPCTIFPIATDNRLSPPDDDSPPPGAVLSLFCPMDCMSSSLPGAGLPTFNELARARDARAAVAAAADAEGRCDVDKRLPGAVTPVKVHCPHSEGRACPASPGISEPRCADEPLRMLTRGVAPLHAEPDSAMLGNWREPRCANLPFPSARLPPPAPISSPGVSASSTIACIEGPFLGGTCDGPGPASTRMGVCTPSSRRFLR